MTQQSQLWMCRQKKENKNRVKNERVGCMERVTWKLTLPYVKQIASENLQYDSGNSNQGPVTT